MHPAPTTPLGQAFAAIIALLIAALAEHAAEHPVLAPGCRATIRQLEKLARRFDAMAAEWQATQSQTLNRRSGFSRLRPPGTRRRSRCSRAKSRPRARFAALPRRARPPHAPPCPARAFARAFPRPLSVPRPPKLPGEPAEAEPHPRTPPRAVARPRGCC